MEGKNYTVKERLEQLEALMGKYTAGGKDLCVAFSGGVDSSLILKAAVKAGTDAGTVQLVLDNQVLAEWKVETAESIAKRDYIWCLCQLMMQFTHVNKINQ